MINNGSIGPSHITSSSPVSRAQKTSSEIHLNSDDKQKLSRILSDSRNQTMDMAQIIDACCEGTLSPGLKQAFSNIKSNFSEISTMFDGCIGPENTQDYMTLNAEIVFSLSQIFGQLHGDGQVGKIFTELNTISSKFLEAYQQPSKANRMNEYVQNKKQDYFLNSSEHVGSVPQKTPMHVHFIADIRELFDLAASPEGGSAANSEAGSAKRAGEGSTTSPGGDPTRLQNELDRLAGAGAPISSAQATPVMGGPQTPPPPSGSAVSPPIPPAVTGGPATSTAVTGASTTSRSTFEPRGYFSGTTNANVAESLAAIKEVKSGSEEEIAELNQRSENAMGRSLRTSVDLSGVDPDRFGVPMKDGFPKPAQVALLAYVDPLLFKKITMENVYEALEENFDLDAWFGGGPDALSTASTEIDSDDEDINSDDESLSTVPPNQAIHVGTLGKMFMMDIRNNDAQKVLNEWQATPDMVTIKDGKLVITPNAPLTNSGEPEAKAFLERLFGEFIEFREGGLDSMKASMKESIKGDPLVITPSAPLIKSNEQGEKASPERLFGKPIEAREGGLDSMKASIIADIDALANSMGMDMDALTERQDALRFEQQQCQLEYQRLSGSSTPFVKGLPIESPAGQSSQYYRWSVLEKEIQTIDKLMEKRELNIQKLKSQINALGEQTDTSANASLLGGGLGASLEEDAIVKMLHEKRAEIIDKAKTMYEQEVSGANSVEAYLAKRAPDASSADEALAKVSLESSDAKITLVYERWGRYHGLSIEKVKKIYNENPGIDQFLTAVSDSASIPMTPEETERLKEQLGANTTFFKTNTASRWDAHQAREAPSDVRKLSQTTSDEIKVDGEQKTINELTPTQQKQVRAADVLTRRYKALINQRVAAEIKAEEIAAARQGMASAVKESVQSYATYLAVQMARWETSDGMSKAVLLSPMCDRQADGEWVVRDNIFSGPPEQVSELNEFAKNALDQAMAGNESAAKHFLSEMNIIEDNLTSDSSTHATYRTHRDIEMAKFNRIEHTVESLTKEHAMLGITLPPVTPATFSGPAPIEQDSGDRAVFMHDAPPMDLWSDTAITAPQIEAKLDEYLRLTPAQVETKAREIMANCGVIQLGLGAFNVDQKIKAIQTRLKIKESYPLTDAERAEFRDLLEGLEMPEKERLWTDCGRGRIFWDSSALQALCHAKINAAALDVLFADPRLLNETNEPSEASIQGVFQDTDPWTHHDSGLLDAAMMCMPESVRQKVAQYGPSIGQADHVNHQVRSDPKNLFDRYMERLKTLDPPPGSLNVIDSEFKAMVRLFSDNSDELSAEQKAEMKAIVEAKLSELTLESIKTPAHQEALAILAETQGDLTNLGIDMDPLTALFFTTDTSDGGKDTSWYAQANASGNPMVARFHSAMTYHALERALRGSESNNDNILKTMLALRSVENQRKKHGSGGNEFMNRITQCVSNPHLASAWTNTVEASLKDLKGVDQGTHQLTKQLHRDIFNGHNINLSSSTLENFRYDSKSGQLKFGVINSEGDSVETFSLDAIAMTLNTNAPKYSDISEVAKGVLKTVFYGDRDMGAGVHVCMGMDPSERADELMTKDQRFLVKGDTVCVKASADAGIEWREHVEPTEQLHQNLETLEHLSVWQSGTTLYFYDQHMDCQYKVEENGPLIRLSDNKTLCAEKITAHGFASLTWTAGDDGTTVVDMYRGEKKYVTLTMNESKQYVNQNGHVLVGTTANQLIFKDGTMFEVWQFDSSGLKQKLRSEDPVSKSPIPVKEYNEATIASFTKPVGAMSMLMWMANHPSEMNDALAWPSEKEVVPFDEFKLWVDAHKSKPGLMQQLQARLDDLVIVDASGQAVQKNTVLTLIKTDPATPNESNALMLLDAAVKQGDRAQINQLCGFIQANINNVAQTPTQRRVLAGLVAGIPDESLKEAMGIVLDGVKVPSSRHIEAYRQLDKRGNNQLMFMANRKTYASALGETGALTNANASKFKKKVDQKYQTLRSQLDNMLVRLGMNDPMSTSYLLNAMIQGDPNGLIPATMRADVERLALNAMFMHTESQYLGDVVGLRSKPEEANKLLGVNRHYGGLIDRVQKGLASPEEKRLLALLMRCEQKLGHRLRKEQYDSVMGFIEGRVSIAQLKTGFGKTDVLLFLLSLYKGHGKGARVMTPKTLIEMNATDYERKLQDFGASVWQPSFNFDEARVSNKPLEQFIEQLTMHNNRGDICFAPIEFDMQLKDLRSESEVAWLNESDSGKKDKLKARIDLLDRIQETMGGMFSVVDEAPVVKDVTKEFNVKAGDERMFDQHRNALGELTTKAIFKFCSDLFTGDICEIAYKQKMNNIAQNVFNEVFPDVRVTVPTGESPFNLADGNDWRTHFGVSGDSPSNGELGLVVSMLTSSALEVSKKQLNWQYGFRHGDNQSLTVVPYEANNKATQVGTSYQNKEMTTMLTVLAIHQNRDGYFGDPSKVSGILSFMATNAQELCQTYPGVFKASTKTELTQLMALAIEVQSAYQGRPMRELSIEFDRLANAAMSNATDDPLAKELRGLMETIKRDKSQLNDLIFKVITNTKESERSFNANTNEIQTGDVQFSGTIDEGLIPAVDRLRGNYETVKVAIKGLAEEQELAAVNEHRFGSATLEGAEITSNGEFNIIGVDDASLKGDIGSNPLIQAFLDKTRPSDSKVQLLVDSGALIQGLSNREVAEYIQRETHQNVVYYDTETDQLRCITNDHGTLSMPDLIAKVKGNEIRKEDIKAFFDQARATGTDIMKVLMDDVEIMLTASTGMEKNEWVQGFGRMRGLGDKMHLVAPDSFVSEVQDGSGTPVEIQHMWGHVCRHTDMKMNQKILKRVQTELNGLIKQEVSKALKTWGTELTLAQTQALKGILSQPTCYDLSEFKHPAVELSDQGALDAYLSRLLDEKRALLEQLPMFQGEGKNFLNGVQFQRVHPPFNRQNLSLEPTKTDGGSFHPKDIATAIIQSAGDIKTEHLAASPLKVSDANTQSQALAQATAQATVQAQATAQAQSQAQAQATAEGSAEVGVFTPSSNGNLTCKQSWLQPVDVKDTLEEAVHSDLTLDQNPSLHQFLTHMNVTDSIRFSHGFLSQCEPGKMPVVHHIFKKGDQYCVFTSEEVAALKPQDDGYDDVHGALFHGGLGLVDASSPDTKESATLLALQCLMDGDHRTELQMASRLNQAYERIFNGLKEATTTITTGITHLNGQLNRLHGVDHFMAIQLLGQLQAQVDEAPSVTLVATDGAFKPVTQKAKQPITIMGLVAGGQMNDIKERMNDAIRGHFWKQEVLTSPSTFRAELRTSMNDQMAARHRKACEAVTGELQAQWAALSTEAIVGEIQGLEAQIAAKEAEKATVGTQRDDDIRRINDELNGLREKKAEFEAQIKEKQGMLPRIDAEIAGLTAQRVGMETHLRDITSRIADFDQQKRDCEAHLRNIERDQEIADKQADIASIQEEVDKLGLPKSIGQILQESGIRSLKTEDELNKAVELMSIVGKVVVDSPFVANKVTSMSNFNTYVKHLIKNVQSIKNPYGDGNITGKEFFKQCVQRMNIQGYDSNKIETLYKDLTKVSSEQLRIINDIFYAGSDVFEQIVQSASNLKSVNQQIVDQHQEYSRQIEALRAQIQNIEDKKEPVTDIVIKGYTQEKAQEIVDFDDTQLVRDQADRSRILMIDSNMTALEGSKSQLAEDINVMKEELHETSDAIAANQAQQVAAQALENTVMALQGDIAALKATLTQKNEQLDQVEGRREAFKSDVPNKIKAKMTELVKAYGFLDEEVDKLLPQFCPTDGAGNIVGEKVTLAADLPITLPTFNAKANQIIGSDGKVNDGLAANFKDDPLMQLLIAAECKAGDWITDANGQRLQLSKDSELIKSAQNFRQYFTESNGEKVWFLLNSTLSLQEKLGMFQSLEGFDHLSGSNNQILKDLLHHIAMDIDASIASGDHSVVQAKDTFCVGLEDSTSDVPCLTEAERLATMTHLSGLA